MANIINGTDTGSGGLITTGDSSDELQLQTAETARVTLTNTAVVVNEGGNDVDFRVEGDTDANLLFVDAGNDRVGIGTSTPTYRLDVISNSTNTTFSSEPWQNYGLQVSNEDQTNNNFIGIGFTTRSSTNAITSIASVSAQCTNHTQGSVAGNLAFFTTSGGTIYERMRITSAGAVEIANGNLKFTTNGTGIDFSASAGGGATSSILDDYEEGTFTPVLKFGGATTGITYIVQRGTYTKIGNTITIQIGIYLSNSGSATGAMTIDGLPFVSINQSFGSYGGELFYGQSGFGSVTGVVFGLVNENSSTIYAYIQNNGAESQAQKANIATYFQFKTTYQTS